MPKRKQPSCLRELSILSIVNNLEKVWWKEHEEHFGNLSMLHVLGPFDIFHSNVLEEIIKVTIQKNLLRVKHLQILVTDRIRHLDLNDAVHLINQNLLVKPITDRCRKLVRLRLSSFDKISRKSLLQMIPSLPELQDLDLQSTKCDDSVLHVISIHCQHLVKLSVSFCRITDNGIHYLCQEKASIAPCQKLRSIQMLSTDITQESVRLLIRTHPDIVDIASDYTVSGLSQTIENLTQQGKNNVDFKIQKLHIGQTECLPILKPVHITSLAAFCKNIREIDFVSNICDDILGNLEHFKNVQKLSLSFGPISSNKCTQNGFLKLLQTDFGMQLTELSLVDAVFAPLMAIGASCHHLKHLTIVCCPDKIEDSDEDVEMTHRMSYRKLESFSLTDNDLVKEKSVSFLLQQAFLIRSLNICFCRGLTNQSLEDAYEKHTFEHLTEMNLLECSEIQNIAVFKLLLETENQLTKISLNQCFNITQKNYDEMKKCLKKKHNWDIALMWT